MEYRYNPQGVCSYEMIIEVEEDTIKKVTIEGGCAGNTVGVSRLVEGMKIEEAIKREKVLKGWKRERKIALFEPKNKEWSDLYGSLLK